MIPIITFVGWHNSGKTTLVRKVIEQLTINNCKVGVIKGTKEKDILPDKPGSDTMLYRQAGAESIALAAPDQIILRSHELSKDPAKLAERYFNTMDIVLAEGFKHAPKIPKIEVHREGYEFLYPQIENVVALVSEQKTFFPKQFSPEQSYELSVFIQKIAFEIEKAPRTQ